ncbi:Cell division control protein 48 like protein E [Cucumispora dikerogammari]|nr:Cell division control protein 48 like protein E [Cucumispora dikerogammari]
MKTSPLPISTLYLIQHIKAQNTLPPHTLAFSRLTHLAHLKPEVHRKFLIPLGLSDKSSKDSPGKSPSNIKPFLEKSLLLFGPRYSGKTHFLTSICFEHNITLIPTNYLASSTDVRKHFENAALVQPSLILIEEYEYLKERHEILFELKAQITKLEMSDLRILVVGSLTNISDCSEFQRSLFSNEMEMKTLNIQQKADYVKYLFGYFGMKIEEGNLEVEMLVKEVVDSCPGFNLKEFVCLFKDCLYDDGKRIAEYMEENLIKGCMPDKYNTSPCEDIPNTTNINVYRSKHIHLNGIYNTQNKNNNKVFLTKMLALISNNKTDTTEKITFDSIGALNTIKEQLQQAILYPSLYPHIYSHFGISSPSSILLYGPPGTGKTLLAKAISSTLHLNFISVKGPELINKYVGDSERHLREVFKKAELQAPSIIFFDEIDSFCGKRGANANTEGGNGEFGNRLVNQMLTLMDGVESRKGVFVIGATNRIKAIDGALLRPGRFDKILKVKFPNADERLDIFLKCVKYKIESGFNFGELNTEGWTGAEIAGFVKTAALIEIGEFFKLSIDNKLRNTLEGRVNDILPTLNRHSSFNINTNISDSRNVDLPTIKVEVSIKSLLTSYKEMSRRVKRKIKNKKERKLNKKRIENRLND